MADNIQIDGLVEQQKELEQLMMSNPAMEKKVQGLIRKVLLAARRTIAKYLEQLHIPVARMRQQFIK